VRSRLTSDLSDQVRLAIASNPRLDDSQIKRLCEDSNREVIFAAEATYAQRLRESTPPADTSSPNSPRETPPHSSKRKPALFKKIVNFFGE
jgi:hypothetical protein